MKKESKKKTKVIIIRGCAFRVLAGCAKELEKEEKKLLEQEWNKNDLIE